MKEIKLEEYAGNFKKVSEEYQYGKYRIFKGFPTNGASVPFYLQFIFKPFDKKYSTPAVIHDFLYSIGEDKYLADNILKQACLENKVSKITTYLFYYAVRIFGRFYY